MSSSHWEGSLFSFSASVKYDVIKDQEEEEEEEEY